jgi:hypothetical protein
MKSLIALSMIVLLSLGASACGGAGTNTPPVSQEAANATRTGSVPATTPSGATPTRGSLKGDEDDDDTASNHTSDTKNDNDADFDNDYKNEHKGYTDSDDNSVTDYGYAASATDRQAIAALAKRYYAAAAAGDGAKACSLIDSTLAEAIPEDYGQAPGPAYLRGSKTCQAVMSLLFKHSHTQLTGAFEVTGVRVSGSSAYALLGSTTTPASYILLKRDAGVWKIDTLLAGSLP